jgi:hypothetical protein
VVFDGGQDHDSSKAGLQYVCFYRGQTKVLETQAMEVSSAMTNTLKTMSLRFSIGLERDRSPCLSEGGRGGATVPARREGGAGRGSNISTAIIHDMCE